ncbi:MAG TPA: vitamin K epoxide reductase family protein [Actinomycetes bacterium]|nr:vitamin K epoxide reductase family protein [Actinomycetes bacterium]
MSSDRRSRTATRTEEVDQPVVEQAPPWAAWTSVGLAALGLVLSVYLTFEHYSGNGSLACSDKGVVNCLKVTTSQWSSVLGIPVAVFGLVFFAVMIPMLLPRAWASQDTRLRWARLGLASVGMASVVYLVCVEAFAVRAICLWCTAVHVVTFLLFSMVLVLTALTSPLTPPSKQELRRHR